jgi:ATP-dependent protease ClpP protease subunit
MGVDKGYEIGGSEPGIDYLISKRFIKNINMCMRANPGRPIIIHMKTCGGLWEEGMAIYDAIMSCPSKVTILNYTHARSMSSLIFQAADKRVMMPHSHFMFHDGTYEIGGTVKQVVSSIEFDRKTTYPTMLSIYTEKMREKGRFMDMDPNRIKKWLRDQMDKKEDVFLTATETVSLGLADEIFDYDWSKLSDY